MSAFGGILSGGLGVFNDIPQELLAQQAQRQQFSDYRMKAMFQKETQRPISPKTYYDQLRQEIDNWLNIKEM